MARAQEVLPPSKLRAKRRKMRILVRTLWTSMCALIIVGIIGLAHSGALRIHSVEVAGAQSVSSQAVQSAVTESLSGNYWWAIPKNNIIVYSAPALEAEVLHDFPKLKGAKVSLDTLHSLKVEIEERAPAGLWCGNTSKVESDLSSDCAFIDESGYVYENAPSYSGNAYLRWYGALSAPQVPAQYLTAERFHSLQPLVESFRKTEQTPLSVVVDENEDVNVSFAEGFQLRFTLRQKPEEVIASLRTAQSSGVLKDKKLSDLLYLDLRFGNRLYYKFK